MAAELKALEQDYEALKEKLEAAKARYIAMNRELLFNLFIALLFC